MKNINPILTTSVFVLLKELIGQYADLFPKPAPGAEDSLSRRNYTIRLTAVALIFFALVLKINGLSGIAISFLFPLTYFYQVWVNTGLSMTSYFACIILSTGGSAFLLALIRSAVLKNTSIDGRPFRIANWIISVGASSVSSVVCSNAVLFYLSSTGSFPLPLLGLMILTGYLMVGLTMAYCMESCFSSLAALLISNLICGLYFRWAPLELINGSDLLLLLSIALLPLLSYEPTLMMDKVRVFAWLNRAAALLTSPLSLILQPSLLAILLGLRLLYRGNPVTGAAVLLIGGILYGAAVLLIACHLDGIAERFTSKQKIGKVLIAAAALLFFLSGLSEVRNGTPREVALGIVQIAAALAAAALAHRW